MRLECTTEPQSKPRHQPASRFGIREKMPVIAPRPVAQSSGMEGRFRAAPSTGRARCSLGRSLSHLCRKYRRLSRFCRPYRFISPLPSIIWLGTHSMASRRSSVRSRLALPKINDLSLEQAARLRKELEPRREITQRRLVNTV